MKKKLILPVILILFSLLFVSCSFWGLPLSTEAESLVGLWVSEGLNDSYSELCYYDFRPNGRVYVTDWTEDVEAASVPGIPDYFIYKVKDDVLTLKQFMGIMKYEFEMTLLGSGDYYLEVLDASGPFEISVYENVTLSKVFEYSREAEMVRALYPEALNE